LSGRGFGGTNVGAVAGEGASSFMLWSGGPGFIGDYWVLSNLCGAFSANYSFFIGSHLFFTFPGSSAGNLCQILSKLG